MRVQASRIVGSDEREGLIFHIRNKKKFSRYTLYLILQLVSEKEERVRAAKGKIPD